MSSRTPCLHPHRGRLAPLLALLVLMALVAPAAAQETGTVRGQVFDRESGSPVEGVTVILVHPAAEGAEPRQDVQVSGAEGAFEFRDVPAGSYELRFNKAGYRASTMTDFAVQAGEVNRADFPLPPRAVETSEEILQLEAFVVEQSTVDEADLALELRLESDQLVNTFSAEDFSKFSAGDVAEALDRVAGVTVADGQFAVIRGLEDRYNSTLYNSAPVPSPDPDKQSVQLDLFPSDIVSNLVVSKTFGPDLPSNSSGGAIDILTHDYPAVFEFKVSGGTGWNTNAEDRFLEIEGSTDVERVVKGVGPFDPMSEVFTVRGRDVVGGSPVGREQERGDGFFHDIDDILEGDYGVLLGGRAELEGREFRFKAVAANEIDYGTKIGEQESREPRPPVIGPGGIEFIPGVGLVEVPGELERSGDLSLGRLNLSDGHFDFTESTREEQTTAYVGFGFDWDEEGNHKLDASFFWTKKEEQTVQLRENGFLPGFDYPTAIEQQLIGALEPRPDNELFVDSVTRGSWMARSFRENAANPTSRGALVFSNFTESRSFERDRDLRVWQINGDHRFSELPGLNVRWAWNKARTTQDDVALGMRFFYEPCGFNQFIPCPVGSSPMVPGSFPVTVAAAGAGRFAVQDRITLSANSIVENQDFYRIDAEYESDLSEQMRFTLSGGMWREDADREVVSAFLEAPQVQTGTEGEFDCPGNLSQFSCRGDTPMQLAENVFGALLVDPLTGAIRGLRQTSNESTREVDAWHLGGKLTLWDRLDLIGGARWEHIVIESNNDPFVRDPLSGETETRLGGPQTFPTRFLFFDRIDTIEEGLPADVDLSEVIFNDQILGIDVPIDPDTGLVNIRDAAQLESLVNGRIDEHKVLPSAAFAIRPIEGLSLRGAWSETVARPSFRELGYYVTVEPGTDDLIVGNPQVGLSDVESYDLRAEYVWGPYGDLVAVSGFWKQIDDPIESIVVRDPTNAEEGSSFALFRTFFNNPNRADLQGIEAEARKSFGFLGFGHPGLQWLNHLSLGGNYTYIDAEVARTGAELARSRDFFGVAADETDKVRFEEISETRRLFNQPEWIANADLTFDHPGWGTRITLAWFAISSVLDAAGTATVAPNGEVRSFTLDRYIDEYDQLDLIVRQTFRLPRNWGSLTFGFTAKNLTDSERAVLYDPEQTFDEIEERSFKIGRDYSFSLTYSLGF